MKKLVFLCVVLFSGIFFGQKKEVLKIDWPKEYEWKVVHNYESDKTDFIILIPKNENENNWTICCSSMIFRNTPLSNVDFIIKHYENNFSKQIPSAKFTLLEKSNEEKNFWFISKIENPSPSLEAESDSVLLYIIQKENTLYQVMIAVKEKTLSKEFIKKWSKVFRSGEFFYEYSDKTQ